MKIYGVDISHHNGAGAVFSIESRDKQLDFFIIKATEGKTYVDKMCHNNAKTALDSGYLIGLYHYARPENNTPATEAANFLSVFRNYLGIAMPVLDYEGTALQYGEEWALEWLNIIYEATGVRPVLYVQYSELKNFKKVAEANYGLWVARWCGSSDPGNVSPWATWALWQYTSSPYDKNFFNGSREQFRKYCKVNKAVRPDDEVEDRGGHCGCSCCK